ncbi:MAG: rod shape-determining protein RodA [Bacteroidales bacterium]|nr:rod shape-determining protein RodA [Bacteroidales bacterium]
MRTTTERKHYDWLTIGLYIAIVLFGWLNIYAACYDPAHAELFDFSRQHGKQLLWIGIALLLAVVILNVEPRFFANTSYFIYVIVIGLLVLTLLIGNETNGGKSWIKLGAFKLQSSEFAKFATALALAKFMSAIDLDIKRLNTKVVAAVIVAVPAGLILLQHDTGSALVFAAFLLPMFREGISAKVLIYGAMAALLFVLALLINKWLLIGIVAAVGLFYLFVWLNKRTRRDYFGVLLHVLLAAAFVFSVDFAFNNVLESHQRERIDVLLGKTEDLSGAGYNVHQSKIAIGSGRLIGKGFLRGTVTKANFVPEQETDFIFCTVGEEWGFFGSTLLVVAYIVLLVHLISMAERQRSTFARFYGYSVASILFFHVAVNVGMVLGLLPVIGIPLPFFSYGGSSLLAFTILLFIFIRQDATRNQLL